MRIDDTTGYLGSYAATSAAQGYSCSSQGLNNNGETEGVANDDRVTISDEARRALEAPPLMLADLVPDLDGDGAISIEEIRQSFQEKSSDFEQAYNEMCRNQGYENDPPVELVVGASGEVRALGDNEDAEGIEESLNDDEELSGLFRGLSGLAGLLKAAEDHQEFAEAYAEDPEAAVAEYAQLFGRDKPLYSMQMSEDGAESRFDFQAWAAA